MRRCSLEFASYMVRTVVIEVHSIYSDAAALPESTPTKLLAALILVPRDKLASMMDHCQMEQCAECKFSYGAADRQDLPGILASFGPAYDTRMARDHKEVTLRPSPEVWSPLEYACHVRDVFLIQRDRLYLALVEDRPSFAPAYREERVEFDGYAVQAPDEVAQQIEMAATLVARAFSRLTNGQWERRLMYNYPTPTEQSVEWLAHHTAHEATHHLYDIDRILGIRNLSVY